MMEWLTYLLKVSACTVLFFGFYLLVLQQLTFFKINRFYLLITMFLSFVIPLIQLDIEREPDKINLVIPNVQPQVRQYEPANVMPNAAPIFKASVETHFDWYSLIPYGYGFIVVTLLAFCAWKLFQLLKYARNYTQTVNGLKLVEKQKGFTNCSFFNYVFVNGENLSESEFKVLLRHEQVHANQYHSIDKILLMVVKSLLWFNPVVYLYNKALEQVHEYEADETTSASFGSSAYAGLLLKLAVTKSDMPLIHNFVKSPIKARIKMLFHAKSKSTKKLTYLLALPVGMGLLWLFAVQFVYANKQVLTTDKAQNGFIGPKQSLLDDTVNVAKAFRAKYAENIKKGYAIMGKQVVAKFMGFRDSEHGVLGDISYNNQIYSFEAIVNLGKLTAVKIGDSLQIKINGFSCPEPYTELRLWANKISAANGQVLYERSLKREPFFYAMNGQKSTYSKIAAIGKDGNRIKTITLNNKGFTIELDVARENFVNNKMKVGDEISATFLGGKLIRRDTYFSNQLIELHSRQHTYALKAKTVYEKYASEIKNEIPDTAKMTTDEVKPKIISFSKITVDVKKQVSHLENAVIGVLNSRLEAKYVEMDQRNNKMIAKDAILESLDGSSTVKAKQITFDLQKGGYELYSGEGQLFKLSKAEADLNKLNYFLARAGHGAETKVEYSAQDSVKMSKDKNVVYLFGNAKVFYRNIRLTGSKIIYNKKRGSIDVGNAIISSDKNEQLLKADSISFDLNTSKARLIGEGL